MSNHPLTDELLYEMFLENCGMGFTDDNMRAAYDKGAADRLEQVIEWLKDELDYRSDIDPNLLSDLKQAMRPQEDNQ